MTSPRPSTASETSTAPNPAAAAAAPPRVDVVLTCYNEGPYIGDAVRSILDQTAADRIGAIVIADDGSAPETVAVLREIEGWSAQIKVLYGPGGVGLPGQRNLAIAETTAPYFAILDGDDLWAPEKLARQLALLDADPDVGLVYTDYHLFPSGEMEAARRVGARDITGAANLTRTFFLNDPPIVPSTTMIRRSAFEAAGRFDATLRLFEDTDLWLRLSRVCRFGFVNAPMLHKRFHRTSLTGGRRDLIAHHAFVALRAATHTDPSLMPLVPKRLAERARKLGNRRFLLGEADEAARLLGLAVRLDPLNLGAWRAWAMARFLPGPTYRLMAPQLRARRRALGMSD